MSESQIKGIKENKTYLFRCWITRYELRGTREARPKHDFGSSHIFGI